MVDKVEQPVVGPVQIFENQHQRPAIGQPLEQAPPGRKRFLASGRDGIAGSSDAHQRLHVALHPVALTLISQRQGDHLAQLGQGRVGAVVVKDAGLCLDDLRQRPEALALAVGKGSSLTPEVELGGRVGGLEQFGDQTALADSGHADQREQLGRRLALAPRERLAEKTEFAGPADDRVERLFVQVAAEASPCLHHLPHWHGPRFSFGLHRLVIPVFDHPLRGAVGLLAHEDAVYRSSALKPCSGVEDVAGGEVLAVLGPSPDDHQRLAGIDGHAHVDVRLASHPFANRQCCSDGPFRVVLVGHRDTKQRDHRIADELLDRAPEPLDLRRDVLVVVREDRLDVLGVECLRLCRRPDQVAEQRRDHLALLARPAGRLAEGRRAGTAEPESVRVLLAAGGTDTI